MFYRRLLPVVAALRSHHLAFLVAAATEVRSSSESSGAAKPAMAEQQEGGYFPHLEVAEGLVLYHDRFSFYSQKVVMALHEKNLSFHSRIVNLIKSEQYEPWFLALNALGEVPVLQDNVRIIPDSGRIIDYLEDNFSNGNTPRLVPMNDNPVIRQNVNRFRHLIKNAPAGRLTTGAVLNPQVLKNPKCPFYAPIRSALANAEKTGSDRLKEYAERCPEAREQLLQKAEVKQQQYEDLVVEQNFRIILGEIDVILTQVEEELATHKGDKENWWLCSESFSIADIELTILLERISQLGLEYIFWTDGKKPWIEIYYERVKQRDSYKKTIPGNFVLLHTILISQAPLVIGVVTAVALIVGGAIIAKKFIT